MRSATAPVRSCDDARNVKLRADRIFLSRRDANTIAEFGQSNEAHRFS